MNNKDSEYVLKEPDTRELKMNRSLTVDEEDSIPSTLVMNRSLNPVPIIKISNLDGVEGQKSESNKAEN